MADKPANAQELRKNTVDELKLRLDEAKGELFKLRVRTTTKELTNGNAIRFKRREIARLNTIIAEKQREGAAG